MGRLLREIASLWQPGRQRRPDARTVDDFARFISHNLTFYWTVQNKNINRKWINFKIYTALEQWTAFVKAKTKFEPSRASECRRKLTKRAKWVEQKWFESTTSSTWNWICVSVLIEIIPITFDWRLALSWRWAIYADCSCAVHCRYFALSNQQSARAPVCWFCNDSYQMHSRESQRANVLSL